MKFTLNRDLVHASLLGHCVTFVKDQPVFVPPDLHKEVMALGAEPEGPLEEPVDTGPAAPDEPAARFAQIRDAIEQLVLNNKREDFAADNKPRLKPLSELVGWAVSAKERDEVLARMVAADN